MKKLTILLVFIFSSVIFSNGVGVINPQTGVYLRLLSSGVSVNVESQIATITTTQVFKNQQGTNHIIFYAFPLPEGASATGLKWKINGIWKNAVFSPQPQDTTMGGGTVNLILKNFLGSSPLFFNIPDTLKADSLLIVELTYVQLLKYKGGNVFFTYPNDYRSIQTSLLEFQEIKFTLTSPRTIDSIMFVSHVPQILTNTGNNAYIECRISNHDADKNYEIKYSLNLAQLGLYDYSTVIPDTLLPDSLGKGFLLFIAEPSPSPTIEAIPKVFTLIIDRSGSMGGEKMEQAKNAATYIVQNFNEGDKFNLIDFDDVITSFSPTHVANNPDNRQAALNYISGLYARGMTDISGAFTSAIPQFSGSSDSSAKIIIFLTDGQATWGLTSTDAILNQINNMTQQVDTNITIFCFGIGSDVNTQLLTLISAQHNGIAEFLGDDELYSRITDFYNTIRNPVLLNTKITFTPNIITEVYPNPLPNLYKGQQLLVCGRYGNANSVNVLMKGNAFGQSLSYEYQITLSDTNNTNYQFLTKIWAKLKIEYLLVMYYSFPPDSPTALEIKGMITQLSLAYGVISPFTSFSGGGGPSGIEEKSEKDNTGIPDNLVLIGNYPNPFNPSTKIMFRINKVSDPYVLIKIYNSSGELVKALIIGIPNSGTYEAIWDGKDDSGNRVASGNYIYTITYGNHLLAGKMVLLK